jgi:hypothetical protein
MRNFVPLSEFATFRLIIGKNCHQAGVAPSMSKSGQYRYLCDMSQANDSITDHPGGRLTIQRISVEGHFARPI